MAEEAQEKLGHLLSKSQDELQTAVGNYGRLLAQLEALQQALESGDLDREVLKAAERAFSAFPRLQTLRAAAATDDGLDATRALLVEIRNRIVTLAKG